MNTGCFAKGHKTWNKGKPHDAGGKSILTRFKHGCRAGQALKNYKPIGAERFSKDGYLQRKVNNDMPPHARWRGVHILIWESINGSLLKGRVVIFKNGDSTDFRIENLECVSRGELMRRNSRHTNYPPQLNALMQLRGALNRVINNHKQDNK